MMQVIFKFCVNIEKLEVNEQMKWVAIMNAAEWTNELTTKARKKTLSLVKPYPMQTADV